MKKSLEDIEIYNPNADQDESLGKIGQFLCEQYGKTSQIRDLTKPKAGSFGELASTIAQETMNLIMGESTLSKVASSQPVGKLFYYENSLLVKSPFNTIVGGQVYVNTLQNRVLELTSVSAEQEIKNLKNELRAVTNGRFIDLIKLAFRKLLNRRNRG